MLWPMNATPTARPMKTIRFNKWIAVATFPALMAFADTTHAAITTYNLSTILNGTLIPGASTTWASATITDITGGVTITFTISSALIVDTATTGTFIPEWYLNFDHTKTFTSSYNSTAQVGTFLTPVLTLSANGYDPANFNGAPDNFDIRIAFYGGTGGPSGGGSAASRRFGVGESATFTLLGTGVTTGSFDFLNNTPPSAAPNDADVGVYHSLADVQGFTVNGDSTSAFYGSVPEPSAGLLIMLTATAGSFFSRKRRDMQS